MSIPEHDRAVLYGHGLFETLRVSNGVAMFLDEHLTRLSASARALDIALPCAIDEIAARVAAFSRRFDERAVRLTLTGGNPQAGLPASIVFSDREIAYSPREYAQGVSVAIAGAVRVESDPLAQHKTLNQLLNVLAWQAAERSGCRESLFFTAGGQLAEGARSNVFVVTDEKDIVLTPSAASGILPGIVRGIVIAESRGAGIDAREARIDRDGLFGCSECFLTNSLMGVLPVRQVGDRTLPGPVPGPVTLNISRLYEARVRRERDRARAAFARI